MMPMKTLHVFFLILLLTACRETNTLLSQLHLDTKLSGKWRATAFNGELHEEWKLGSEGWMQQQGYYIEKNDTTYTAKTQILKVDEELILFSVIKNANPKIFKSVLTEENKLIFENKDYKNPYQVTYEFLSEEHYRRTLTGYEKDSLVVYEFEFQKVR